MSKAHRANRARDDTRADPKGDGPAPPPNNAAGRQQPLDVARNLDAQLDAAAAAAAAGINNADNNNNGNDVELVPPRVLESGSPAKAPAPAEEDGEGELVDIRRRSTNNSAFTRGGTHVGAAASDAVVTASRDFVRPGANAAETMPMQVIWLDKSAGSMALVTSDERGILVGHDARAVADKSESYTIEENTVHHAHLNRPLHSGGPGQPQLVIRKAASVPTEAERKLFYPKVVDLGTHAATLATGKARLAFTGFSSLPIRLDAEIVKREVRTNYPDSEPASLLHVAHPLVPDVKYVMWMARRDLPDGPIKGMEVSNIAFFLKNKEPNAKIFGKISTVTFLH